MTPWVSWFVQTFTSACIQSQAVVRQAVAKAAFWQRASTQPLSVRQCQVLERLLQAGDGGFLGGMTADKYSKITGISKATATRDLSALAQAGLLLLTGAGKATRYVINVDSWNC